MSGEELAAQPYDEAAEKQVLGSVLVSNGKALDDVALDPDRFHIPAHSVIAEAMLATYSGGKPCDPVTITSALSKRNEIRNAGGAPYLHALYSECLSPWSVNHYWQQVTDAWERRQVIDTGRLLVSRAHDAAFEPGQIVDRARDGLDKVTASLNGTAQAKRLGDLADDVIGAIGKPQNLFSATTGWPDLDDYIGGWRPGTVTVVAARPGNGKSLLGLAAARHVAKTEPVLLHSLEMTGTEMYQRALSAQARVNLAHLTRGDDLTEDEWSRVSRARGYLDALRLTVDDRSHVSVTDILASARTIKRQNGSLGLVVIDYIQLVNPPKSGNRNEPREQQVSAMSRAFKVMAKDLEVPVVVLAQLNRGVEMRQDGIPRPSDLRESGSLEQDADVVLLLHRDVDQDKNPGEVQVIVGKNRHGERGATALAWQAHYADLGSLGRVA